MSVIHAPYHRHYEESPGPNPHLSLHEVIWK